MVSTCCLHYPDCNIIYTVYVTLTVWSNIHWVTSLFGLVFRSVFLLSPKYRLRLKVSEKWSRFFRLDSAITEQFAETKLETQQLLRQSQSQLSTLCPVGFCI